MTLQETSFCSALEMERIQAVTSGLPAISCSSDLSLFLTYRFFAPPLILLFLLPSTTRYPLHLHWQIGPMWSPHAFIWERWILRVAREDQSGHGIPDPGTVLSTISTNWQKNKKTNKLINPKHLTDAKRQHHPATQHKELKISKQSKNTKTRIKCIRLSCKYYHEQFFL